MAGPLLAMMSQMGGMAFGSQLGQALGKLSREVLTSTDIGLPLGPKGVAALMPEAVESLAEGLEQPRSEILTFLAAREAAHHRLFSHVPWLSSQLLNAVEAFAKGMKIDMSGIEEFAQGFNPASLTDPSQMEQLLNQGIFEPKATPEQTAALERLETLLALIEGWVQTVVTDALGDRIPGTSALSRDAAPAPRHRRPRRADLRHAGRTGTAAAQAARGRGAVGAADRRPSAPTPATRCGSTPTCCPAPTTSTSPRASSTASSAATPAASTRRSPTSRRTRKARHRRSTTEPGRSGGLWITRRGSSTSVAESSHGTATSLNPAMPVLLRPDGAVQVGWDPRRAVLVRPPDGIDGHGAGRPAAPPAIGRDPARDRRRTPTV